VRTIDRFSRVLAIVVIAAAVWTASALAGPYTRLQVLLPGESPAPGTASGKTGTPRAQTEGVPFTATVRACDASWNLVTSISNVMEILSSDGSATLPPDAALSGGTGTFSVTLNAAGSFTIFAHD